MLRALRQCVQALRGEFGGQLTRIELREFEHVPLPSTFVAGTTGTNEVAGVI
jgi:hypothetical protein